MSDNHLFGVFMHHFVKACQSKKAETREEVAERQAEHDKLKEMAAEISTHTNLDPALKAHLHSNLEKLHRLQMPTSGNKDDEGGTKDEGKNEMSTKDEAPGDGHSAKVKGND